MQYFCFDVESDGLYGEAFAVGAVVMNEIGECVDSFSGIAEPEKVESDWVKQNCLPKLEKLPAFESRRALREAFWAFYMKYRENAVITADVPVPVEAGFLRACVEDDLSARMFLAPYPLVDVASVLFAAGIDPDTDRTQFGSEDAHNPVTDAENSCRALLFAMGKRQS